METVVNISNAEKFKMLGNYLTNLGANVCYSFENHTNNINGLKANNVCIDKICIDIHMTLLFLITVNNTTYYTNKERMLKEVLR